jgi:hypothetical protein
MDDPEARLLPSPPRFRISRPPPGLCRRQGQRQLAPAYASDWQGFARWCRRQGFDADAPDAGVVGLYLTASADGTGLPQPAVSTIERRLAAITTHYRSAGTPLDRRDRHIIDVMAGIAPPRPPAEAEGGGAG